MTNSPIIIQATVSDLKTFYKFIRDDIHLNSGLCSSLFDFTNEGLKIDYYNKFTNADVNLDATPYLSDYQYNISGDLEKTTTLGLAISEFECSLYYLCKDVTTVTLQVKIKNGALILDVLNGENIECSHCTRI